MSDENFSPRASTPSNMLNNRAFTLKEAAEYAHVSFPTMQNWANRQDFPAFRSGRRWIIPREPFIAWLADMAKARAQL